MWIIIFVEVKSVYLYYSSWDLKSVSGKRFHGNIKAYSCEASKKKKKRIQFSFNTHKQFLVGNIYILYLPIPSLSMLILIILVCFLQDSYLTFVKTFILLYTWK